MSFSEDISTKKIANFDQETTQGDVALKSLIAKTQQNLFIKAEYMYDQICSVKVLVSLAAFQR